LPTEIGVLTAKFVADTTSFDRGLKKVEGGMKTTASQAQAFSSSLNNAISRVNPSLGQMSAGLSEASAGMGALGAAAGVAVGAIAAVAAGAIAAGAAIYSLTTDVAEATGKFKDLAQQTGFSVETLSALANAAETSGGSIESVTSALFLFETKMGEARDSTSEMGKLFKELNISTTNNEAALRQALDALQSMTTAEDKATVGKKLFGRSVKDLLGALAEAGSLDAFMNEQLKRGTLITTEAAERGDKLADAVTEMGRAFESVRRVIADQFGPDVLRAVQAVTRGMEENRGVVQGWARSLYEAGQGAAYLASKLYGVVDSVAAVAGMPIPRVLEFLMRFGGGAGIAFTALQDIGRATAPNAAGVGQMTDKLLGPVKPSFLQWGNVKGLPRGYGGTGGGGGGRGGGGGGGRSSTPKADTSVADQVKVLTDLTNDMERAFENATDAIIELGAKGAENMMRLNDKSKDFAATLDVITGKGVNEAGYTKGGIALLKGGFNEEEGTGAFGKGTLKKSTDAINVWAEDVANIFGNLFNNIDRGWKGMLNSLIRDLQSIGSRIISNQIFRILSQIGMNNDFVGTKAAGIGDTPVLGKAAGGPVSGGTPYIVGERGPELFVPQASGNIVPNGGGQMRIAIFDDRRRMADFRPDVILKAQKQMRKIGKLASV
jgi:hypothetical protein